jgi:hypothetical protein
VRGTRAGTNAAQAAPSAPWVLGSTRGRRGRGLGRGSPACWAGTLSCLALRGRFPLGVDIRMFIRAQAAVAGKNAGCCRTLLAFGGEALLLCHATGF